jgi:hypothetical protein
MSVPSLERLWVALDAEPAEPAERADREVTGHYCSRTMRRLARMTPITGWM